MSDEITIEAEHDGTLSNAAVREALEGLDVSESSPVDARGRQLGTALETREGEDDEEDTHVLVVSTAGHGGGWTQTSEQAVLDAIRDIDAVVASTVEVVSGGYDGG